jgi:succinyl-CoA synthetase beta subunit
MNLHEYQAKLLLAKYGITILQGRLCYTVNEAEAAYDYLKRVTGQEVCVVKAQVHAGGRGKGGGVKVCKDINSLRSAASTILGMNLVTPQTGAKGKKVNKIYVEAGCQIAKEFYLSFLVDRGSRSIAIVASSEGGMDIEEVAENSPEKIVSVKLDPKVDIQSFQCNQIALALGFSGALLQSFNKLLVKLYRCFVESDLSMLEINPLVLTSDNSFIVLDAKVTVDGNALFRQAELRNFADYDELDPKDLRASKFGLSYVALDGNIGCMVNGAGLAMATMDIIKAYGGDPANFLDVGGGASQETVTEAFKILLSDEKVRAILVNIFGGIMKCDVIAQGIVEAAKSLELKVPLVVRLQGTNVELGRSILEKSGLKIQSASTMSEAAELAVASVV